MSSDQPTADMQSGHAAPGSAWDPGLLLLASSAGPTSAAIALDRSVCLGRDVDGPGCLDDAGVSREHCVVTVEGDGLRVRDLGSRNGTFVDGQRVRGEQFFASPRALRLGGCVLAFVRDLGPHVGPVESGDAIVGPVLRAAWQQIDRAMLTSRHLLVTGESGVGKELAARRFHTRGPFVAVNCAAIPDGLAESLLFGARKGAFSGATEERAGYFGAADGGTLLLDEVGELDLAVQAKLLRALEVGQILPLGAATPRPVDVRVCLATLRDLRAEAVAGRFRLDLFYRIARPELRVPPLRERVEELAFHVHAALTDLDPRLRARASLLEACVLRPWPGNVRELVAELRLAGDLALRDDRWEVRAADLGATAGLPLAVVDPTPGDAPNQHHLRRLTDALTATAGNVAEAARRLGVHRTQLRRWIEDAAIDVDGFRRRN
jgi:transcriptional regulator with GAF, ATPase, and Fis domain